MHRNHNEVIKSKIKNPKFSLSPFLFRYKNNHPLKWCFGYFYMMRTNKQTEGFFCLVDIHNDLSLQNNKHLSFPCTHPPPLLQWSPYFNYKLENCYVINNNACILFIFPCEFFGSKSTLSLSISQRFSSFSSSGDFCPSAHAQMESYL